MGNRSLADEGDELGIVKDLESDSELINTKYKEVIDKYSKIEDVAI
ncbi:hypothetical protein LQE93_04945 [Clostridium sp. NSJ-145]|nr:hypothetical protein [Clostridium sp. NSJ-145]MCD2501127.1 hypothetical protein [Clostridium sp. NSJ-145]